MNRGLYILLLIVLVLYCGLSSASLGISPAKQEINFIPGESYEFSFIVSSDDPNKKIELYLAGDLSQYATLSKTSIVGAESFKVFINLPSTNIAPGKHNIIVRGREPPSENEFISTRIDIGAPINIFVPYPGNYAELILSIPTGNVASEISVELLVINRGLGPLVVASANIDFFTDFNLIDSLSFEPLTIDVSQQSYFRKYLNTSNFKPGDYTAMAKVDTGQLWTVNTSFKIGSLNVTIRNATERIPIGGIQKYHVTVDSNWNNPIQTIFADINISSESGPIVDFRTSSLNLDPWETKTLEGFIDTDIMKEGEYRSDIAVFYADQQTLFTGKLSVYREFPQLLLIGFLVSGLVALAGIIYLFYHFRRKLQR